MMKRAQTPILIGLIAACASCFRLYAHQVGASDWQWVLWGARLLLQDQNPYHIPPEYLPYAQHTPLFYPLPAVFLALPIAWLPSYVAGAIFVGVIYPNLKRLGLLLATQPVTHDTVIQATEAAAGTIGRMTPAYYGFGGPPVEHGSSTSCKPGALPLTVAKLVC